MGKTSKDRIRNETVRRNLGVKSLMDLLKVRQLKWLGHAETYRRCTGRLALVCLRSVHEHMTCLTGGISGFYAPASRQA